MNDDDNRIGYEIVGDKGQRMRFYGAVPGDEDFAQESVGCVNVSRMWRDIQAGKAKATLRKIAMTPSFTRLLEARDVDPERLKTMTPADLAKPLLLIHTPPYHTLVDGTHRMAAHMAAGSQEVDAWVFGPAACDDYGISIWKKLPGGQWVPLKVTEEEIRGHFGKHVVLDENRMPVGVRHEDGTVKPLKFEESK